MRQTCPKAHGTELTHPCKKRGEHVFIQGALRVYGITKKLCFKSQERRSQYDLDDICGPFADGAWRAVFSEARFGLEIYGAMEVIPRG